MAMPQIDNTTRSDNNVFQQLIDLEGALPTAASPVQITERADGIVTVAIHGSLYKKLIQYAKLKDISLDEAKREFASVVVPVLGKTVLLERKAEVFASSEQAFDTGLSRTFSIKIDNSGGYDAASVARTVSMAADGKPGAGSGIFNTMWGPDTPAAKAMRAESKALRRAAERASLHAMHAVPSHEVVRVDGTEILVPAQTHSRRHDTTCITIDQMEVQIDAKLKQQGDEMRKIFEDVLKKQTKNPLFNLRIFEGKFFSPQLGEGDDAKEIGWVPTLWAGVKGGVKLSVKSLVSVTVSAALLAGTGYLGNKIFPSTVPSPTAVVAAVFQQFKNADVKAEVGSDGVKFTVEKGKGDEAEATAKEVTRLLDTIGGAKASIPAQKAYVQYLRAKTAEALLAGRPLLVSLSVVEGVEKQVHDNENKLLNRVKDKVSAVAFNSSSSMSVSPHP